VVTIACFLAATDAAAAEPQNTPDYCVEWVPSLGEAEYVTDLEVLTLSGSAKISIVKSGTGGTLSAPTMWLGVYRMSGGTLVSACRRPQTRMPSASNSSTPTVR
jgi:hypothetical protein